MKLIITEIRGELNAHKGRLNEANLAMRATILKYISDKIGYKEFKKQTNKILKTKSDIIEVIDANILRLEEIENDNEDNTEPKELTDKLNMESVGAV